MKHSYEGITLKILSNSVLNPISTFVQFFLVLIQKARAQMISSQPSQFFFSLYQIIPKICAVGQSDRQNKQEVNEITTDESELR